MSETEDEDKAAYDAIVAESSARLRRDLAEIAAANPAPETGWLIELRGGPPQWWYLGEDGEDGQGWTSDSLKALRFARKQDAEAYIGNVGWTEAFATEHEWATSEVRP